VGLGKNCPSERLQPGGLDFCLPRRAKRNSGFLLSEVEESSRKRKGCATVIYFTAIYLAFFTAFLRITKWAIGIHQLLFPLPDHNDTLK